MSDAAPLSPALVPQAAVTTAVATDSPPDAQPPLPAAVGDFVETKDNEEDKPEAKGQDVERKGAGAADDLSGHSKSKPAQPSKTDGALFRTALSDGPFVVTGYDCWTGAQCVLHLSEVRITRPPAAHESPAHFYWPQQQQQQQQQQHRWPQAHRGAAFVADDDCGRMPYVDPQTRHAYSYQAFPYHPAHGDTRYTHAISNYQAPPSLFHPRGAFVPPPAFINPSMFASAPAHAPRGLRSSSSSSSASSTAASFSSSSSSSAAPRLSSVSSASAHAPSTAGATTSSPASSRTGAAASSPAVSYASRVGAKPPRGLATTAAASTTSSPSSSFSSSSSSAEESVAGRGGSRHRRGKQPQRKTATKHRKVAPPPPPPVWPAVKNGGRPTTTLQTAVRAEPKPEVSLSASNGHSKQTQVFVATAKPNFVSETKTQVKAVPATLHASSFAQQFLPDREQDAHWEQMRLPESDAMVCYFHAMDTCRHGAHCRYRHFEDFNYDLCTAEQRGALAGLAESALSPSPYH